MKIFISWGKDGASHDVALALRGWLPCVIQATRPFVSDDIDNGQIWVDRLFKELGDTNCGIVCVTANSLSSPWLNWEAGAISKGGDMSRIFTLLFHIEPNKLSGPLEPFQFAEYNAQPEEYNKERMRKLVQGINKMLDEPGRVSEGVLNVTFERWWPDLRDKLNKIPIPLPPVNTPSWLSSVDNLNLRLENENCKEVWVITPDLKRQLSCDSAMDLLRRNLARGVIYKYLVPETDEADMREMFQQYVSECGCPPEVKSIDDKVFKLLVATTYVLLNPLGSQVETWLEAPTEQRGNWIKVNRESAVNFSMRFGKLINARAAFIEDLQIVIHTLDEDHGHTLVGESQAAPHESTPTSSLTPEP